MSDPVEILLNSPRSIKAMQQLGLTKDDLRYLTKEELKAKIGNMKIHKAELEKKWEEYETDRKNKVALILQVSYILLNIPCYFTLLHLKHFLNQSCVYRSVRNLWRINVSFSLICQV